GEMIYGRQTKTAMLADKLRTELLRERLPKDTPVMSARELADRFGVSVNTADRILALLVEQGFLYRRKRSGSFIKNDPPVIPAIAYAGCLPDPENLNPLKYDAAFRLLEHFTELGIKPKLITYHTLRHPELAAKELDKTNGLLLESAFIDDVTLKALWDYSGKIVLTGNTSIENRLPCSQVVPDFTDSLLEFNQFSPFSKYDRILVVRATHQNSVDTAENVLRVLTRLSVPEKKIQLVLLDTQGSINAYLQASRSFSQHSDLPEKTLIVSMSEYFSQAIREVFSKSGKMPDILSFDNMEDYGNDPDGTPYFTSVDRQMGRMACLALDLLCSQLDHPGGEQTILRIPAKLVIRESVKNNG
ncbi:MAG: GntR family transcriptional regulator, partial [Lentisphaeria bacterium]|nr:GntR family transcriptional regulator [Lentisphaeria bacterium]